MGVMEREPLMLAGLFRWLTGHEVKTVQIRTQMAYATVGEAATTNRPDMTLVGTGTDGSTHILMIESKLGSAEGANQLSRYVESIKTMFGDSRTLAYITKYRDEDKKIEDVSVTFKQKRWVDVYRYIRQTANNGTSVSVLVHELLRFMEQTNMNIEIHPFDLIAGSQYAKAVPRFWDILEQAWERSGLSTSFQEPKASGRWSRTETSPGDLNFYSPGIKDSHVQIAYGFHFNLNEPGPLMLSVNDTELPILFVALHRYDGATPILQSYKDYLDSLVRSQWVLGNSFAPNSNWIARKEILLEKLEVKNLSESLATYFVAALSEIKTAPFLG